MTLKKWLLQQPEIAAGSKNYTRAEKTDRVFVQICALAEELQGDGKAIAGMGIHDFEVDTLGKVTVSHNAKTVQAPLQRNTFQALGKLLYHMLYIEDVSEQSVELEDNILQNIDYLLDADYQEFDKILELLMSDAEPDFADFPNACAALEFVDDTTGKVLMSKKIIVESLRDRYLFPVEISLGDAKYEILPKQDRVVRYSFLERKYTVRYCKTSELPKLGEEGTAEIGLIVNNVMGEEVFAPMARVGGRLQLKLRIPLVAYQPYVTICVARRVPIGDINGAVKKCSEIQIPISQAEDKERVLRVTLEQSRLLKIQVTLNGQMEYEHAYDMCL